MRRRKLRSPGDGSDDTKNGAALIETVANEAGAASSNHTTTLAGDTTTDIDRSNVRGG